MDTEGRKGFPLQSLTRAAEKRQLPLFTVRVRDCSGGPAMQKQKMPWQRGGDHRKPPQRTGILFLRAGRNEKPDGE